MPVILAAAMALQAQELRRIAAADADQGVASDGRHVYAIDNHTIAKIDARTGRQVARWTGDPAHFRHINSCTVEHATLICAASNYPDVPMASMIERFDARDLHHLGTQDIGHGQGSLTWVLRHKGSWWACFANYDGHGGEPGRDHRTTTLVRYDPEWHEQAQWAFPEAVLGRMAPKSASGGAWGKDGLLYVTGHDRAEVYALRVPDEGGVLELVAVIAMPTGGQAIDWDRQRPRTLWSIERATKELVASRVPPILPR
ncbi:hypothetical protein [Sphingomonas crusticola]|uniref:hypothetical protein n=1 Tax=Sphingomonas crusticola TaxID=1697973 RepID=UPI001F076A49|nr:hypothetical protein [Sphingomonas crusticola]